MITSCCRPLPSFARAIYGFSPAANLGEVDFFTFTDTDPRIRAAGVLPYAWNLREITVLLSQEAKWEGPSSEKWKGFGGKRDPEDPTIFAAAAREAEEESGGLLKITPDTSSCNTIACKDFGNGYFQLMVPISYDEFLVEQFQREREKNLLLKRVELIEKSQICWFPLANLLDLVRETAEIALKQNCRIKMLQGQISLNMRGEKFVFAADFLETMSIVYKKAVFFTPFLLANKNFTNYPVLFQGTASFPL